MARSKNDTSLFPGYRQVQSVNTVNLTELVNRAIGDRSLDAFVASVKNAVPDSRLNKSTVSRLRKGEYSYSGISFSTIRDIAAAADPNSGITAEMLLEANGYQKVTFEKVNLWGPEFDTNTVSYRKNEKSLMNDTVRDIIVRELFNKGYNIGPVISEPRDGRNLYRYDFEFITNAHEAEGITTWAFDVKQSYGGFTKLNIQQALGRMYMCNDTPKDKMVTFVLFDHKNFKSIVEALDMAFIREHVSIMLIDLNENRIIDEYCIHSENGDVYPIFRTGVEIY